MAALPDDVWLQVFRFGLQQDFSYRDLCTIPFVCRRFKRIARDDSLWNILYSKDWPSHSKTNENDKSDTHSKSQALWMRYEGEEQDNLGSSSLTAVQLKPQRKRTASIAFGRTWKEKYVLRYRWTQINFLCAIQILCFLWKKVSKRKVCATVSTQTESSKGTEQSSCSQKPT